MRTDATKSELLERVMTLKQEVFELRRKLRLRQDFPFAFAIGDRIGEFWRGLRMKVRGF